MHSLTLPAGASARFTATARSDGGVHRWDVHVLSASDGATRLTFGSRIGGRDLTQRIEIPVQNVDCRLEVHSRHEDPAGWRDDQTACLDDTPDALQIGFCDPARPGALPDDVLFSFAFEKPASQVAISASGA
jgi:hypothetical protein